MMLVLLLCFSAGRKDPKEEDSMGNKEEIEIVDAEENLGPEGIDKFILLIAELTRRRRTTSYLTASVRSAWSILLDHGQEECHGDP